MFKLINKILSDCAKGRNNKYSFLRVGTIIGCTYLLIMTTALFVRSGTFSLSEFSLAFGSILGMGGVAVGVKNKLEQDNK